MAQGMGGDDVSKLYDDVIELHFRSSDLLVRLATFMRGYEPGSLAHAEELERFSQAAADISYGLSSHLAEPGYGALVEGNEFLSRTRDDTLKNAGRAAELIRKYRDVRKAAYAAPEGRKTNP